MTEWLLAPDFFPVFQGRELRYNEFSADAGIFALSLQKAFLPLGAKPMTSRQRILTALAHREPDRVPYDLGGIGPSGISIGAYARAVNFLGLDEVPQVGDLSSQRAKPSEDFLRRVGVDTRPLGYGSQGSWSLDLKEEEGATYFFDEWGIGRSDSVSPVPPATGWA